MSRARPRIGYVTSADPGDRRAWSGIHHFMSAALGKHCGEVVPLGPIHTWVPGVLQTLDQRSARWLGRRYDQTHSLLLALVSAQALRRRIAREPLDVLVAPAASTEIAFLRTRVPIVYLSDATFALIRDYYPAFSNLLAVSAWEGNVVERAAIRRARALVYATEWAAASAVRDYGAPVDRTHVVPFGANLEEVPTREVVLARRGSDRCRLLFVGVSWERKGGQIALDALRHLERCGVEAELIVCGCTPPPGVRHERMTVIPFLDKRDRHDRKRLQEIFLASDVFLLPTRAECSGIVFCEAYAFGLPVVTTDTGGVSGVVRDDQEGVLLPLSAGGERYAAAICELRRDPGRSRRLARAGRVAFEERLNWDAWGMKMKQIIAPILSEPRREA